MIGDRTYYIYRHIRHDKNEPFYIGKGTVIENVNGDRTRYKRAYTSNHRNNMWWSIVNKSDYEVEILFETTDKGFINKKETEFILLYGRIDNKTGTLCNYTDGGEGAPNVRVTDSLRDFRKKMWLGKRHTEETKKLMSIRALEENNKRKQIIGKNKQTNDEIHFESIRSAARYFNVDGTAIWRALKDSSKLSSCGFSWRYKY